MSSLRDLSPRELQILRLVVAGKTNKAIAREIYISQKTVEFHLDHIHTKVGARTRLRVSIWAIQQGLAEAPRDLDTLGRDVEGNTALRVVEALPQQKDITNL